MRNGNGFLHLRPIVCTGLARIVLPADIAAGGIVKLVGGMGEPVSGDVHRLHPRGNRELRPGAISGDIDRICPGAVTARGRNGDPGRMPRIVLKQVQKRMAAEGQDLAAVVYIFFIVDESVKWEPLAVRQNEQIALAVVENRTIRQILRIDEGDGLSVRFKETFQVLYIRRGLLVRRQQGGIVQNVYPSRGRCGNKRQFAPLECRQQ